MLMGLLVMKYLLLQHSISLIKNLQMLFLSYSTGLLLRVDYTYHPGSWAHTCNSARLFPRETTSTV